MARARIYCSYEFVTSKRTPHHYPALPVCEPVECDAAGIVIPAYTLDFIADLL